MFPDGVQVQWVFFRAGLQLFPAVAFSGKLASSPHYICTATHVIAVIKPGSHTVCLRLYHYASTCRLNTGKVELKSTFPA